MSLVIHPLLWKSKSINDFEEVMSILEYTDYDLAETFDLRFTNKQSGIRAVSAIGDILIIVDSNLVRKLIYNPLDFDFSKYDDFELGAFSYNDQIGAYSFSYFKNGKAVRSVS